MKNNKSDNFDSLPLKERLPLISDEQLQRYYNISLKNLTQQITPSRLIQNQRIKSEIERRQSMGDTETALSLLESVGQFRNTVAENKRQAILKGNRKPNGNSAMEIEEYNRLGQQARELLQQAGILGGQQQNPFQLDAQEQDFSGTDLKYFTPKKYADGSKTTFTNGLIRNVDAIPNKYTKRIVDNANVFWPKGDEIPPAAKDEEIAQYFVQKVRIGEFPMTFKRILDGVFPFLELAGPSIQVDVNPDLQKFAKLGFRVYKRVSPGPKNNLGISVGTTESTTVRPTAKYMAKATNTASPYERVVLGQARRLIKRLISFQSLLKMNIKSFNKAYEVQKGDYNKYKYLLPGTRINKLKNWARKYGTTIPANVKEAQIAANKDYMEKLQTSLDNRIAKFDSSYPQYFTPFNLTETNKLIERIPAIRKRPLD